MSYDQGILYFIIMILVKLHKFIIEKIQYPNETQAGCVSLVEKVLSIVALREIHISF